MKVKILQEDLQKGLSLGQRFVASRPQLPILANFLLSTDRGQLKLAATDLNLGLQIWLGGKVEEEGEISVPAKEITEFVSYLPSGEIELQTEKQILKVIAAQAEANFAGLKADEFPRGPTKNEKNLFKLEMKAFAAAVDEVSFAAANDDSRPVLEGILWQLSRDGYRLVATDGYRLALKEINHHQDLATAVSFLIPARSLNEAVKLAADQDQIQVSWDQQKSQILFIMKRAQISSRLLSGEFPDYQKIIPTESKIKVLLDRQQFLTAIRAVSVFARSAADVVVLDFQPQQLVIRAESSQVGQNEARVTTNHQGEAIKTAFNYHFLLDFLNHLPDDEAAVEVRLNEPLAPVLFSREGDKSLTHLIMPVRLDH